MLGMRGDGEDYICSKLKSLEQRYWCLLVVAVRIFYELHQFLLVEIVQRIFGQADWLPD